MSGLEVALRISTLTALCLALALVPSVLRAAPPAKGSVRLEYDPVLAGEPPFRRLFLDAMVTEESWNLQRVFHPARKHPDNPIFEGEMPWEGWGPNLGGTVIREGGRFRMYYYSIADGEPTKVCLAESVDGLNWRRPELGLVEWQGSKKNNIVPFPTQVFRAAGEGVDPPRRWIGFGYRDGKARLGFSADGLSITWDAKGQELFTSSDVINWFFDPYRGRICATWKTPSRRHRSVGVAFSDDLFHWTKPVDGPVFVPDDLDPDATQIYGMPVFAYQGMFIGLPLVYHARWIKYGRYTSPEVMFEAQEGSPRTGDVQLAWSWDLINWTRTADRRPFIPNSPVKAFDCGFIGVAREPVVMGDELWFYYSGWDQVHEDYRGLRSAVGLATLRLDGFCSMRAGEEEGWLISRREVFKTPKVTINAKCAPGGYVVAELLDRNNNVIRGFEKNYCIPFTGDSVRGELAWKTARFPDALIDRDKKIRFYLKDADLYSYVPADINQEIDDGWPDH